MAVDELLVSCLYLLALCLLLSHEAIVLSLYMTLRSGITGIAVSIDVYGGVGGM